MRIGLSAPRREASFGGVSTYEQEVFAGVMASAHRHGHTLVVFARRPRPERPEYRGVDWIRVRAVPWRHAWASCKRVVNYLVAHLLHLPSPFAHEHWIDAYLGRCQVDFFLNIIPEIVPTQVPYFIFVLDLLHRLNPYFPEARQSGQWLRREERIRRMVGCAAVIGVGTEQGKRDLLHFFPASPSAVHIIPYPTPSFALEPILPRPPAIPEFIYYPANFHAHKNHATVLAALTVLRSRYNWRPRLVLSGRDWGNLYHVRALISDWQLSEQVEIAGFVSREKLKDFYQTALAMVFASLLGPDNIPPLEAFGLGCPAVIADIPGAREQVLDAAIMFPPTDETQLAEALWGLKNAPELRAERIRRGRARAEELTAAKTGEQILASIDSFAPLRRCWGTNEQRLKKFNWRRLIGG